MMLQDWSKLKTARYCRQLMLLLLLSALGLVGCTHPTRSIIPQDGPEMKTIYARSYSVSPTHQHPNTVSLMIFAHDVTTHQERIRIPTYTVQFLLDPHAH